MKPHSHSHRRSGRRGDAATVVSNHTHTGRFHPRPEGPAFQDNSYATRGHVLKRVVHDKSRSLQPRVIPIQGTWGKMVMSCCSSVDQQPTIRFFAAGVLFDRQSAIPSLAAKVPFDRHQFDPPLRQKVILTYSNSILESMAAKVHYDSQQFGHLRHIFI